MSEDARQVEGQGGSEWDKSNLEDLLSGLLTGGRPTGGGLDEGEYISIGGTQINSEGYIDLHGLVYIPEDYFEQVENTQLQKHDILVVKDGSNTGDVAIAWESDDRIVTNEHIFTLRTDSSINPPYLFYFLSSHKGWKQIHGTITGSAQEGINRGFAKKVNVKYPPLSEQRKIATILHNLDQAIQKTGEIIDKVGRVKTGLRQNLFRNWSGSTVSDPLVGEYPEEWELMEISEIVNVTDAEHFTPDYIDSGIPVLRPGDLSPGKISLENVEKRVDEETYNELTRRYTPTNRDIVYSRSQNFAVASQVIEDSRYCLGQDTVIIEPDELNPTFLLHLLNAPIVKKQAIRRSTGSTFSRVNLGDIQSFKIPVPSEDVQQEIATRMSGIEERLSVENEYQKRLKRLKRGLMQDLLSGKVRTTDIAIEPSEEIVQHG